MDEPDAQDPLEGFPLLPTGDGGRPPSLAGRFRVEAFRIALGTGAVLLWRHRDEIIARSNRIFFWMAFGGLVFVTLILAFATMTAKVLSVSIRRLWQRRVQSSIFTG
jgi:hypothetical protein